MSSRFLVVSAMFVPAAVVAVMTLGSTPAMATCHVMAGDQGAKAVSHYNTTKEAALRADYQAQVELARLYREGQGVAPDLVQAYAWLNVAAGKVSDASKERDKIARCLDTAQQLKAQIISVELLAAVSPR